MFVFMDMQTAKSVTVGIFLKMVRKEMSDLLTEFTFSMMGVRPCQQAKLSQG